MVESIKELNRICQKPDYKTKGNWYVRTILRDAALPVTWLLLHTDISADQVTLVSLAVALLGMVAFALPGTAWLIAGVLLLQLWYYLDHVDGQIARYRKTVSMTGRFLDYVTHHIVHTVLLFALSFYVYQVMGGTGWIVWGFVGSMAILLLNLIHDVKYKTFFEWIEKGPALVLKERSTVAAPGSSDPRRKIFSLLHKLCEVHVMMNLLSAVALLQIWIRSVDFRLLFFIVYGVVAPVVAVAKLAYILKCRKIDSDYESMFERTRS